MFLLARWSAIDEPLIYTFLDIPKKKRKDILAADAPLGQARINKWGSIYFGKKIIHKFR